MKCRNCRTESEPRTSYLCKKCDTARKGPLNLRFKIAAMRKIANGEPACMCCGEDTLEFLTIDHKGGGGNAHRVEIGGRSNFSGYNFYRWILNSPRTKLRRLRILCANCNQATSHGRKCPHEQGNSQLREVG